MIALALAAAPTLAAVALPPHVAGEVILAGQDHRPIEMVAPVEGFAAPGVYDYALTEQPVIADGRCDRRSWQVSFRAAASDPRERATLETVHADEQVALRVGSNCGPFATAANGISSAQALDALRFVAQVAKRGVREHFTCDDDTGSGLCRDDQAIRGALATLPAWAVVPTGNAVELWLGTRGSIVTAVRYDPAKPGRVSISRRVPAPF